jgi:hypothetical protein
VGDLDSRLGICSCRKGVAGGGTAKNFGRRAVRGGGSGHWKEMDGEDGAAYRGNPRWWIVATPLAEAASAWIDDPTLRFLPRLAGWAQRAPED